MHIMVGGAVVTLSEFFQGSFFACLFSSLFILAGRGLLGRLTIFQQDKVANCGYYYLMGICFFLVLVAFFSKMGALFNGSVMLSVVTLLFISLIKKRGISWSKFFIDSLRFIFLAFFIGFISLLILNVIAKNRDLIRTMYAEVANYIVSTKSLLLINRHYGQSVLAAIILTTFKSQNMQLGKMAGNLWLPLSQAFLLLVIYDLIADRVVKNSHRLLICIVAFSGSCALSLLPQIPIDHDFPLIFNLYPDSVIGLGIVIIAVTILVHYIIKPQLNFRNYIYLISLLYILFAALNQTAELNILVFIVSIIPVWMLALLKAQSKIKCMFRLFIFILMVILALFSNRFMGGIFMPNKYITAMDPVHQSMFSDSGANSSVGSIKMTKSAQWYLPYETLGFYIDFGNYISVFDEAMISSGSLNKMIMNASLPGKNHLTESKVARIIYLTEIRLGAIFKILFWPLLACGSCLWLLLMVNQKQRNDLQSFLIANESRSFLFTKEGLIFSIMTFLTGLSDILLNSFPGNSLYWKWALTRLNEIGIFLMMIYFGIFYTYFVGQIKSNLVRRLSLMAILVLTSSGVILRVFVYPSFDG